MTHDCQGKGHCHHPADLSCCGPEGGSQVDQGCCTAPHEGLESASRPWSSRTSGLAVSVDVRGARVTTSVPFSSLAPQRCLGPVWRCLLGVTFSPGCHPGWPRMTSGVRPGAPATSAGPRDGPVTLPRTQDTLRGAPGSHPRVRIMVTMLRTPGTRARCGRDLWPQGVLVFHWSAGWNLHVSVF